MDSSSRIPALALFVCTLWSACGSSPAAPSRQGPLKLDAGMTSTRLAPGETSTATFTLQNVSSRTIALSFISSCQILPYVRERATRRMVHPREGWGCALVLTSLVLGPGESRTVQLHLRAADAAAHPVVALPAGDYEAYAQLDATFEGSPFSLRSPSLQFSVE